MSAAADYDHLVWQATRIACPDCSAQVGQTCLDDRGRGTPWIHLGRTQSGLVELCRDDECELPHFCEPNADRYHRRPVHLSTAHVPCPHCEDGHGAPGRTAWHVYVDTMLDCDGQPVRLIVQPTAGAHVAEDDRWWLWRLIAERDRVVADRPLDFGPDGVPRLRR